MGLVNVDLELEARRGGGSTARTGAPMTASVSTLSAKKKVRTGRALKVSCDCLALVLLAGVHSGEARRSLRSEHPIQGRFQRR
jgi:hypothetical protein